jgi:3alpha(or 20beta)-hydroxysteroid dehydrogenase
MSNPFTVDGKVVLITGAARGIGATCAEVLAEAGAKVMLTDVLLEAGEATAAAIREKGGTAEFMTLDVTSESDWKTVVEATLETFGGLDVMVNNAGIEIAKPLLMMDLADFQKMYSINVEGVFLGSKFAVAAMMPGGAAGKGGSIINMSSIAGLIGAPGMTSYGATKGAIRIFSKGVAVECGQMNIRVNSVHPGFIRTAMGDGVVQKLADLAFEGDTKQGEGYVKSITPLGHIGETLDVATAVQFLASEASKFVTGTELVVDGGLTAQ